MTKRVCDPRVSAERIRTRRKQLGLTQKELSEKSGIQLPTIKQYELGKRVPDGDYRMWLADALGVYERWIIGESDSMNFQTDLNKLGFYIRDKRKNELEIKMENWSDTDKQNHERIVQMLRELNKPLTLFEDILELSGHNFESMEKSLMIENGLSEKEFKELSNAYFNKILDFVRAEYSLILENASNKAFFDKYIGKEKNK